MALLMKKTVNCSSLFIGTYSIYSILCFLHEVFMKVQVISGATPETFNFLISRCSNVILSVGGETPAFQRILFMLLQTLAVKGYLNMWRIEIFKENVKIWFIELLDMGQWSASQNRLDRAENMSLLIFLLILCLCRIFTWCQSGSTATIRKEGWIVWMKCIDIFQLADFKAQMVEHILFMYQLLIIILMIMQNRMSIIVTGLFILKDMPF